MKKRNTLPFFAFFLLCFFFEMTGVFSEDFAWYVSASGNNENLGTAADEPFKTLTKAVYLAARSQRVKTIIVLGTLDYESEGNLHSDSVFLFDDTGSGEIVVKGAPQDEKKAVLSAESSGKRVITIRGLSKVRFENIEISGGISNAGAGVHIRGFDATVTFAQNCVISNNAVTESGGGVFMEGGIVSILGADISDNFAGKSGGGIYISSGVVTVKGGTVSKNTAKDGGGMYLSGRGRVSAENVTIKSNKAQKLQETGGYGGGVFIEAASDNTLRPQAFLLKSGEISSNSADGLGGGVYVETDDLFFDIGGKVTENVAKDVYAQQKQPEQQKRSEQPEPAEQQKQPEQQEKSIQDDEPSPIPESSDLEAMESIDSFLESLKSLDSPPDSPIDSPIDLFGDESSIAPIWIPQINNTTLDTPNTISA